MFPSLNLVIIKLVNLMKIHMKTHILFADDPLQFKKIVYEMRFDETTARYGDFGSFYVGHILPTSELATFFKL